MTISVNLTETPVGVTVSANSGAVSVSAATVTAVQVGIGETFAPAPHSGTHASGGSDPISPGDIGAATASHGHAASDITSGTIATARLGSGTASASTYLRGDQTWATVAASYTLPDATTSTKGGVIVGTGLSVSSGTVSVSYGSAAGTACSGADARLSDARTPTDGSVTTAKLADGSVTAAKIAGSQTVSFNSVSANTLKAGYIDTLGEYGDVGEFVGVTAALAGLSGFGKTIDFEYGTISGFDVVTETDLASGIAVGGLAVTSTLTASGATDGSTLAFSCGNGYYNHTLTLTLPELQQNRTVYLPDASGTIALVGDAPASHVHAASDITSGTFTASTLPLATTSVRGAIIVGTGLAVSSGTVSVSYGSVSGSACAGNDSRLSDSRNPTSHSHGSITNAGAIGSTADRLIVTGSSGVLTTATIGSGLTLSGGTLTAAGGGSSVGSDLYLWSVYR